jgi:hypothetical protein
VTGEIVPVRELAELAHAHGTQVPLLKGGGAVRAVTLDDVAWADLPHRLEAGTPNVLGAIALAAACDELTSYGLDTIEVEETRLAEQLWTGLEKVPGARVLRAWDCGERVVDPRWVWSLLHTALGEAWQPVVGDRLPRHGVGDELPPRGPDAGVAVEGAEPDRGHVRVLRVPAPERAAAGAAEDLHEAVRRPVVGDQLLAGDDAQRAGTMPPETDAAVPVRRWQRVQWQYPADWGGAVTS